MVTTQVAVWGH
jgi:hypothetical protein